MAAELAPLKMERAVFATEITKSDPGPEGCDEVAFTVATNPGAPSGPLNKIASGGELSRFLLALKVCLTKHASGLTMIFDEIDRGVGGATADAVGRRSGATGRKRSGFSGYALAAGGRAGATSLAGGKGRGEGHDDLYRDLAGRNGAGR